MTRTPQEISAAIALTVERGWLQIATDTIDGPQYELTELGRRHVEHHMGPAAAPCDCPRPTNQGGS